MGEKPSVRLGTMALMVLKTLDLMGLQHGYGLARRIEQISGDAFPLNYGTSIQSCSSSSRKVRSNPSGDSRKTTAGRSSTD